jgi:DNA-directed RNA polymerase subunit RPC12/RpoP
MKTIYVCSECGSSNIEMKAWVNPNTNEIFDTISTDQEDCWCNDCEEHYALDTKKEE